MVAEPGGVFTSRPSRAVWNCGVASLVAAGGGRCCAPDQQTSRPADRGPGYSTEPEWRGGLGLTGDRRTALFGPRVASLRSRGRPQTDGLMSDTQLRLRWPLLLVITGDGRRRWSHGVTPAGLSSAETPATSVRSDSSPPRN